MVQVDKLGDAIGEQLIEYVNHTSEEIKKIVLDVADDVKKDIQATAPIRKGKYVKSWGVKKVKENSNSINVVVHSEKHYQLTHLLEFGHALRNGGRSKAIPHIAPAEQRGIENFEKRIMEGLDG